MNSITVNIFGNEYSISGDAESGEIEKYARYLDTKLAELSTNANIDSKYKLSILCSLNIIEDMFNQKDQLCEIEKYLKRMYYLLDSFSPE